MRGASTASLAEVTTELRSLADSLSEEDLLALGDELFAVTGLLHGTIALRRSLSDPARSGEDKAGFVASLLSRQISSHALGLVQSLVRGRWASPVDLVDATETLAVHATVAAAVQGGRLDTVEDDLFRFRRIVDGQRELRLALTDPTAGADRKSALLDQLLGDKVSRETRTLLRQVFVLPRGRSFDRILDSYSETAAEQRNRLVARVTTAVELTGEQRQRLADALRRLYSHEVHLDVDVDPDVLGGIRVAVGDEVIDGTLMSKLEGAQRRAGA